MFLSLLLVTSAFADTSVKDDLYKQLSGHHAPSCEALVAGRPAPEVRDALISLVNEAPLPSWVPMRAAACVVDQMGADPAVVSAARGWMGAPETPGLALVVSEHLEKIPGEAAVELAQLAVERANRSPRFAAYAHPVLARSANPKVSALAAQVKVVPRPAAGMVKR